MKPDPQVQKTVLTVLKRRYFRLLAREHYPHTPTVTQLADNLEVSIRKLQPTPFSIDLLRTS